jgi:hypothetical protein
MNAVTYQTLFNVIINVFVDEDQIYIEEGFNILNLLLYK